MSPASIPAAAVANSHAAPCGVYATNGASQPTISSAGALPGAGASAARPSCPADANGSALTRRLLVEFTDAALERSDDQEHRRPATPARESTDRRPCSKTRERSATPAFARWVQQLVASLLELPCRLAHCCLGQRSKQAPHPPHRGSEPPVELGPALRFCGPLGRSCHTGLRGPAVANSQISAAVGHGDEQAEVCDGLAVGEERGGRRLPGDTCVDPPAVIVAVALRSGSARGTRLVGIGWRGGPSAPIAERSPRCRANRAPCGCSGWRPFLFEDGVADRVQP